MRGRVPTGNADPVADAHSDPTPTPTPAPSASAASAAGSETSLTELLGELRAGRREALDRILPLVYSELRRVAHRELKARPSDTLNTTALVHEVYLRLFDNESERSWKNRAHFLGVAAIAMRGILVDLARRRGAAKRGGTRRPVTLDEDLVGSLEDRAELLLDLDEALTDLAALDDRLARVVECRFFGGMTDQETASALGVTERTVRRDWVMARGLLYDALRG
jgi:RNA polymerase sigma factor (TIGR02999 family)